MVHKRLGRTGIEVSRLGFGAMRLPSGSDGNPNREESVRMIHRAFELGVNYIDTAVGYCNFQSQPVVGEALKGWRDRVYVSTKNHYRGKSERAWWNHLEDSLERLDVEYIDIYNIHGINWDTWEKYAKGPHGILSWMKKARDQGLIRHICCSFHDTAEALRKIAATEEFSAVTLQYNLLDRTLEPALEELANRDIGVIVMGPVGGGRLAGVSEQIREMLPEARSNAEVALRFVLSNPNVTMAISGMSTMEQVEENCAVASRREPLTKEERQRVDLVLQRMKGLSDLYCTGCNYCMPCESGVEIPQIFLAVNQDRVYGLKQVGQAHYNHLAGKAIHCIACGKCEPKCPQNIPIRVQIREAAQRFDSAYGTMAFDLSVVRQTRQGFEMRAGFHNLSDQPGTATVSLSGGDGFCLFPTQFKLTVDKPFHRCTETLVLEIARPHPSRLQVSADIEDAKGRRTETFRFAFGNCYRAKSIDDLMARSAALDPLRVADKEQVLFCANEWGTRFSVNAWAGHSADEFLLYAQVRDSSPELDKTPNGNVLWYMDMVFDLRAREHGLAPGFQRDVFMLRTMLDNTGRAEAQRVRGSVDTAQVHVTSSEHDGIVEIRVQLPWKAFGEKVASRVPTLKSGECIGFDIVLARTNENGFPALGIGWGANPRIDSDARSGTLLLTG